MFAMQEDTSREEALYHLWQDEQSKEWEQTCVGCGMCCGVKDNDPCEHLGRKDNGTYYCRVYTRRFGVHHTISGKKFCCVPVRDLLHHSWPGDEHCAYKKKFLNNSGLPADNLSGTKDA